MEFAANFSDEELPDPFYGGEHRFDTVFKMITIASQGLLKQIMMDNLIDHKTE